MKTFAGSLVRDQQVLNAHFIRWINLAYREISRQVIIPKLNNGDQVVLTAVSGSTNKFYCPYDYCKTIAFVDGTGRSLDPIQSSDVRQFGEYNTFGSFAQFFEQSSANFEPLADSGATPITIGISNRGTTVTASAPIFVAAHAGEWLLPLARNTDAGADNPEDYAYLIDSITSTTQLELARPFRGVLSNSGGAGDLTNSYFEIRPSSTPIIRIWGDPGSTATINMEYQRVPSKLANDEDRPEEPRLSEAIVHKAIKLSGIAYREGFMVKSGDDLLKESLALFQTVEQFDKLLQRNFMTTNPMVRGYSQIGGRHIGDGGHGSARGIRYG